MRRALPVAERYQLETRAFRPGVDEEAWLTVNNRAFDWHPEQGGWDEATLKAREAEPWFDPNGFLLHDEVVDGHPRLAGFCWTRVHADHDPPLGEIYVVAVDPDFQGRGLGSPLGAGRPRPPVPRRAWRWACCTSMPANRAAVKLYIDLGFDIDHIDRAYVGDVAASGKQVGAGSDREAGRARRLDWCPAPTTSRATSWRACWRTSRRTVSARSGTGCTGGHCPSPR